MNMIEPKVWKGNNYICYAYGPIGYGYCGVVLNLISKPNEATLYQIKEFWTGYL